MQGQPEVLAQVLAAAAVGAALVGLGVVFWLPTFEARIRNQERQRAYREAWVWAARHKCPPPPPPDRVVPR